MLGRALDKAVQVIYDKKEVEYFLVPAVAGGLAGFVFITVLRSSGLL